ncbi:FG-GAP repeat domain-containing protein [Streptomyces sp. SDT5-1]|uniref:FG-GAP repeat domain-containing protein n=1 Tax=Streptomyces sp. SDT5-1 TaxID=3406418 RepID=UPI003FD46D31
MPDHIRRGVGGALCAALLAAALTGCGGDDAGDRHPVAVAGKQHRSAPLPVPRGKGSRTPSDFNGDGAPDLVVDDLAHDGLGDDPGIGIVYGRKGHGPDFATRQLLSPATYAASAFASEAACDLDRDGYTDLVVSTDPPYDGQGMPPVPLRILFGSPTGIAGKGATLKIPARARFGNEWPDQPVCGDFDGDGRDDLVVHASGGRLSVLPGPFTRGGAPRGDVGIARVGGNVPTGPAADIDDDGVDDVLLRAHAGTARTTVALGGPNGFTKGPTYASGTAAVAGPFGVAVLTKNGVRVGPRTIDVTGDHLLPSGDDVLVSTADTTHLLHAGKAHRLPAKGHAIAAADYDGDGHIDTALQSTTPDRITIVTGTPKKSHQLTFRTRDFSD